ncbi:hypothetical protein FDA33_10505 [Clostridium botulinum]|nr:hypothetical protein [Clostridium botulinum]KOR55616.1 hypothetical protein ADT22_15380 [Clostridium botulinum]MCS6112694.1 hypothetical protein [Clostridium botulinum]NFF89395.1 hypothetical protein [Clostridium botulinum]NFG11548.1 hypothetical protein [Clostridium botulinum]NFH90622.1 hypothetical protein [Clostridium botulinum]
MEKRNIDSYKIDIDIENNKFFIFEIVDEENSQIQVEGLFENAKEISDEFYYLIKGTVSNAINRK